MECMFTRKNSAGYQNICTWTSSDNVRSSPSLVCWNLCLDITEKEDTDKRDRRAFRSLPPLYVFPGNSFSLPISAGAPTFILWAETNAKGTDSFNWRLAHSDVVRPAFLQFESSTRRNRSRES